MHDEAFEQYFGLGNGDFEHKFSKYQNFDPDSSSSRKL